MASYDGHSKSVFSKPGDNLLDQFLGQFAGDFPDNL
jgi:hypothetical protein